MDSQANNNNPIMDGLQLLKTYLKHLIDENKTLEDKDIKVNEKLDELSRIITNMPEKKLTEKRVRKILEMIKDIKET